MRNVIIFDHPDLDDQDRTDILEFIQAVMEENDGDETETL